jgi:hypothetical protein
MGIVAHNRLEMRTAIRAGFVALRFGSGSARLCRRSGLRILRSLLMERRNGLSRSPALRGFYLIPVEAQADLFLFAIAARMSRNAASRSM